MAIARTSKRLTLRTEASARFERGCDPAGIDRAAERFCELLALTAGPDLTLADGRPRRGRRRARAARGRPCGPARVNGLLGTGLSRPPAIAELLAPLGMAADADRGRRRPGGRGGPDLPARHPARCPMGEADLAEEVARTYGYARLPRRHPGVAAARPADRPPAGPPAAEGRAVRPGGQRGVDDGLRDRGRPAGRRVRPALRRGHQPAGRRRAVPAVVDGARACCGPCVYNAERRQGDVRLFEVGSVFRPLGGPGPTTGPTPAQTERLCAVFAGDGRRRLVGRGRLAHRGRRPRPGRLGPRAGPPPRPGRPGSLHEYRSARCCLAAPPARPTTAGGPCSAWWASSTRPWSRRTDWSGPTAGPGGWAGSTSTSDVAARPGAGSRPRGRSSRRRSAGSRRPTSTWPSWCPTRCRPGTRSEATLASAGGELLESVQLFDVYRGESCGDGRARSLAYRLRFCALDRTLTDEEDRRPAGGVHRRASSSGPPGHAALSAAASGPRVSVARVDRRGTRRQESKPRPTPVEGPQPQVPPALVGVGPGHRPPGQVDPDRADRLGREGDGLGRARTAAGSARSRPRTPGRGRPGRRSATPRRRGRCSRPPRPPGRRRSGRRRRRTASRCRWRRPRSG